MMNKAPTKSTTEVILPTWREYSWGILLFGQVKIN